MNAVPYRLQLRDPRWQRRRLERMQVAHFTCEECAYTAMIEAPTPEGKRAQAQHMSWLVAQRSQGQVARMERRRGLR